MIRNYVKALLFTLPLLWPCAQSASAQTIALPNFYTNQPGCTYYVSNSGTDNSSHGTARGTGAFLTIQYAQTVVSNYVAANGHTVAIGVCIQTGDYYSPDYASQAQYNVTSNTYPNATESVLDIAVSGTSQYPIWFMGDPQNTTYPTLHQSGYNGISFEPGVQYITIQHLNVVGQAQNPSAPTSTLLARVPVGVSGASTPWAFYDGNCIGVVGNYPTGTPTSAQVLAVTPNHITILSSGAMQCGGGGIGLKLTDYVNIIGNQVIQNAWWSIFQTSGLSTLDNVDIDTVTSYKVYIANNLIYGNEEKYGQGSPVTATDGEGIIVDTNMNSGSPGSVTIKNGSGQVITPPAYNGRTLVANNVVWANGSSAIEAFHSRNVDVFSNSTYHNLAQSAFATRGEMFVNNNSNLNFVNNVMEAVNGSQPFGGVAYSGTTYSGYIDSGNNVYYMDGGSLSFPSFISQYGYNDLQNPQYETPTPSAWYNINLTTLHGTDGATNGAVCSGSICSATSTDLAGTTRTLTSGHYPAGAYAGTY